MITQCMKATQGQLEGMANPREEVYKINEFAIKNVEIQMG